VTRFGFTLMTEQNGPRPLTVASAEVVALAATSALVARSVAVSGSQWRSVR